ncbi:hypothetical protein [Segatella copri]|uniref:Uncharacterized protein n=1 Tax=Segatella copri TaxID=165179 RepID=A0AA92W767_9BACT|nr:hypothetical protein [Segatella copri]RGW63043.1 hypothetical protein DWV60_15640 [Segatella copri]
MKNEFLNVCESKAKASAAFFEERIPRACTQISTQNFCFIVFYPYFCGVNQYIPYIARTDNYIELDDTYYPNGQKLTEAERLQLQTQLNNQRGLYGEPPLSGRATLIEW